MFDAETWAFVHFLMFGDEGARAAKLGAYAAMVAGGKDHAASFAETLGPVEPLESAFRLYYQRDIFSYRRINLDVSVERERFPVRPLPPAESASLRALFHTAMKRPVEARAAIAEARKVDPNAAGSYVAEGLLADQDSKPDQAKVAYAKAAELGATSAFAYFRLAQLTYQPNPSSESLTAIEQHLTKAVRFNTRFADAYAWLGEVKVYLGNPDGIGFIRRAITIEPFEARYRLRAGQVMLGLGKPADARADAQAALTLADNDADRAEAQRLLESATKAEAAAAARPAPAAAPADGFPVDARCDFSFDARRGISVSGIVFFIFIFLPGARLASCRNDDDANTCVQRPGTSWRDARRRERPQHCLPVRRQRGLRQAVTCRRGRVRTEDRAACGFAGFLYERGRGVATNAAIAASFYNQACEAGDKMGCVGFALLQARGNGVIQNERQGAGDVGSALHRQRAGGVHAAGGAGRATAARRPIWHAGASF